MAPKVIVKLIVLLCTTTAIVVAQSADAPGPVIIKTVAQHYENPTIEQYSECTKSRDKCINNCGFVDKKCQSKCQICPILIDQDILVQGINDTLYRLPISTSKVNQTNIIRLSNEIRNIIQTSLGNITTHNQNNITVYHKVSKTGGKFGLGYTEKGSCCHLIEPQRCRSSSNGPICTHRRLQTCGAHCISRVMRAKRVVTCSETDPDNCKQSVEYLPQLRRPGCVYTSKWPFISCNTEANSSSRKRTTCGRCYQIPYLSIIRGQVPRACLPCFGRSSVRRPMSYGAIPSYLSYPSYPSYPSYSPYSYPSVPIAQPAPLHYDYNFGSSIAEDSNEFPISLERENDFKIEEQKCINDDGTVIENCNEDDTPLHVSLNSDTNVKDDNDTEEWDYDSEDGRYKRGIWFY